MVVIPLAEVVVVISVVVVCRGIVVVVLTSAPLLLGRGWQAAGRMATRLTMTAVIATIMGTRYFFMPLPRTETGNPVAATGVLLLDGYPFDVCFPAYSIWLTRAMDNWTPGYTISP